MTMNIKIDFPLVSVIIPTRNRPMMLKRALRSVASQTYRNIEAIVVNDGSEFINEAEIRKEIDFHAIRILRNVRKAGASGARNTGFYASKGLFIGFLDDDDEWMPEKIEKQVEALMKADNKVGIVCTQYFILREGEKIIRYTQVEGDVYDVLCKEHIAGNTSNPLIKRHVLEDVNGFDEALPAGQDTDLWIRIAKRYHFITVYEPLALIHEHHDERITRNAQKQLVGIYMLLYKHWSAFSMRRRYKLLKRSLRLALILVRQFTTRQFY
jgi:glycosyltransferase involved in cell wall biosynthesis